MSGTCVDNSVSPVLEVDDVRVGFRGRRRQPVHFAVDGVGLRVERGRTTGLVGESGAGKSTLARVVLGLVPLLSGRIRFLGQDITELSAVERRALATTLQAVYQDPTRSLNPSYSVAWSLAEPMRAQGIDDRALIDARIATVLDAVAIDPEAARRKPSAFSGGQLQRICIARAIVTSPELVVLDEALSALDLSVQAQILNLLADLQDERALSYLFISHDMSVVRHFCHDIVVLYQGRVMEVGSTIPVSDAPAHPYTWALMQASPVADPDIQRRRRHVASFGAVGSPSGQLDAGCPYAARCPFAIERCRRERPELREVEPGRSVACHRSPDWINEADTR